MKRLIVFLAIIFLTYGCAGIGLKPVSDNGLMERAEKSAADTKVTGLAELAATPESTDILMIVDDPGGTPASKKITVANLLASKQAADADLDDLADGSLTGSKVASATDSAFGAVELSTDAESVTGTSDVVVVTPGTLTARLAAPGAIGGETPSAGTFTDVVAATVTVTASASPGYTPYDSDCPGADKTVGFIGWQYVDGADGSENSDWLVQVMQGGVLTTILAFDESDDQFEFKKNVDLETNNLITKGIIKGRMEIGPDITGSTAHDTTELHNTFNPFTAAATITLDAAADAGYGSVATYWIRDAGEAAVIDPQAGEKLNLAGTALAAGVAITATGVGKSITIIAVTDTDGSGTDGYICIGNNGWASE